MRDLNDQQMEELERNRPRVFSADQERIIERAIEESSHGPESGCPIDMCEKCLQVEQQQEDLD